MMPVQKSLGLRMGNFTRLHQLVNKKKGQAKARP
jgi:hypothetical protein